MIKRLRVLILSYGEVGHAMECPLKEHHKLDVWVKCQQDNFQSVVLKDAVSLTDIVLFCLPVNPHREIAKQVASLLKKTASV